jgi:hypothetical protein
MDCLQVDQDMCGTCEKRRQATQHSGYQSPFLCALVRTSLVAARRSDWINDCKRRDVCGHRGVRRTANSGRQSLEASRRVH